LNFLAHFQLAWPDDGLIAGALEGDYYKGPLREDLQQDIARGVSLHRAIDAYTDQHPRIAQLRGTFPPALRRFAGILIDLSFDHYLSVHWRTFSTVELQQFITAVYGVLRSHEDALSKGSRSMLRRMIEYNILSRYQDWDTIPASAARVGQRFQGANPLEKVEQELQLLRPAMEAAFLDFYPELQTFCRHWDTR